MDTIYLPELISPHPTSWLAAPASSFSFVLQEANALKNHFPHLLHRIEADLQKDAIANKRKRLLDRQARHQQHPFLPGTAEVGAQVVEEVDHLNLDGGRPRMSARTCFLFLVIRGYLGGIKSIEAKDFLTESLTLRLYLVKEGMKMPSLSTIIENTNKVSQQTLDAILDAQIQWIKERGLDDFRDIMIDSTVSQANSCWPTDSGLMLALVKRLLRGLEKMEMFDLPKLEPQDISGVVEDLHLLNFQIACAAGKKDAKKIREEKYTEFLDQTEITSQVLTKTLQGLKQMAQRNEYLPSLRQKVEQHLTLMDADLETLVHLICNATMRVIENLEVPTSEKVPSISDPDAAFIKKGQRETKLGYRPQISKSEAGFVVALKVPEGNAADSEQFRAICEATFQRTGVVPDSLSVDDGYTSQDNWRWAKQEKGVEVVSFSGAKGKKVTPEEDWLAEAYREARRKRSAVESVIFQLKRCFEFGRLVRRGIEKVREELTAKVIAFNFYRLQYLTRL